MATGQIATRAGAVRPLRRAAARVLGEARDPMRAAVLARSLNALARIAPSLGADALLQAAAAASDYDALIVALAAPEVVTLAQRHDPLAGARVRGLKARAELLDAEGGPLGAAQVARLLRLTPQAVDKRRRAGRLLAVSTGRRGYAYPSWQIVPGGVLPGLERVLRAVHGHDAWTQLTFFVGGSLHLAGRSPLEAMRRGDIDGAERAARAFGNQVAA